MQTQETNEVLLKTKDIKSKKHIIGGIDITYLMLTTALLVFGVIMLFSASYAYALLRNGDSLTYVKDQLIYIALGLVGMIIMINFDYRLLIKWLPVLYVITVVLLLLVWVPGIQAPKGSNHRWIKLPMGTFQPSELAKFCVIVVGAWLIFKNHAKMKIFRFGVLPFIILIVPLIALVFLEKHMSGTILLLAITAVMMFVGGMSKKYFIAVGVLVSIVAIIFFIDPLILMDEYQYQRIEIWQNPFANEDIRGEVWQTCQSLIAIGSGGLMGVGFGNSVQKFLYLPEPHNDFIFAIICEELGLIGASIIILLFMALIWRGFCIASNAPDKFGAMIVIGITSQIAIQFLLNIAVVTNAIPNTGISMPFFSSGGTAIIMLLGQIGVLLNISRHSIKKDIKEKERKDNKDSK